LENMFMLKKGRTRVHHRSNFESSSEETKSRGLFCKEHDDDLSDELTAQIAENHAVLGQEPGAGQHLSQVSL